MKRKHRNQCSVRPVAVLRVVGIMVRVLHHVSEIVIVVGGIVAKVRVREGGEMVWRTQLGHAVAVGSHERGARV